MNKKGFVLTIDATIALILVIIILVLASYYINKANEPSLSKLQLKKRGSDILTQLNYQKVLDTADKNKINDNLTNTLPVNLDMRLQLNFTGQRPNVTVGVDLRSIGNIGSGRQIFVLTDDKKVRDYYIARYWIWLK